MVGVYIASRRCYGMRNLFHLLLLCCVVACDLGYDPTASWERQDKQRQTAHWRGESAGEFHRGNEISHGSVNGLV